MTSNHFAARLASLATLAAVCAFSTACGYLDRSNAVAYTLDMPTGWEDLLDEGDRQNKAPTRETSFMGTTSGEAGGVFQVDLFTAQPLASVRDKLLKAMPTPAKREPGVMIAGLSAERYSYACPDGNDEPCHAEVMFLERGNSTFTIIASYHTRYEHQDAVKADLDAIRRSWKWR